MNDAATSNDLAVTDDDDEFRCTIVAIAFETLRLFPLVLLRKDLIAEAVEAGRESGMYRERRIDDTELVSGKAEYA